MRVTTLWGIRFSEGREDGGEGVERHQIPSYPTVRRTKVVRYGWRRVEGGRVEGSSVRFPFHLEDRTNQAGLL